MRSFRDVLDYCIREDLSFDKAVLEMDSSESGLLSDDIGELMKQRLSDMKRSVRKLYQDHGRQLSQKRMLPC